MKNSIRIIFISIILLTISACATKPVELNRETLNSFKISTLDYQPSIDTISITPSQSSTSGGAAAFGLLGGLVGAAVDAGVNSKRRSALTPLLANIEDFDANEFVKGILNDEAKGIAFASEVTFGNNIKKKALGIPKLMPLAAMEPNMGVLNITMTNTMYQAQPKGRPYVKVYSSSQLIESDQLEVSKEANQSYWINNPDQLLAKLKAGFTDVTRQFIADMNGDNLLTVGVEETSDK